MTGPEQASRITGGVMRKRSIELALMAAILSAGLACSSSHSNMAEDKSAAPAPPAAEAAPQGSVAGTVSKGSAVIDSAAFAEDSDGARVVLNADSPLLYTSYEPRPDLLVIDLSGARTARDFSTPSVSGGLVQSFKVEPMNELGRVQTRLSIEHKPGLKYDVVSQGKSLAIAFEDPAVLAAQSATPPTVSEAAAPSTAAAPAAPAAAEPVQAASVPSPAPMPPNVAPGETARALEGVEVRGSAGKASVTLLADGWLNAVDFTLENPPRVVLDLAGVRAHVRKHVVAGAGPVLRARISQFRTTPEKVARVVIDLDHARPYTLVRDGERLTVRLGEASAEAAAAPKPTRSAPSRTELAEVQVPPPAPNPASTPPVPAVVAPPPASAAAPEPPAESSASPLTSVPKGPGVESIPKEKRAPGVLEAHRVPKAEPRPAKAAATDKQDVLFESAEAMLDQQQPPGDRQELVNTYKSRTVGGAETQYTGEPISLDLKDADIKDVFRTISELTGLNIVIDPDVRGTVTVRLENVPWDQALELILKQNGLGYILENNVMRIATTAKLQREEQDRAALAQARLASLPTKTVIKKLSYANASQAAATVKQIMSPRGDIIVDARTNTLIIKEIPDYMPTVIQLIENLDTPTPQVVIESRIVETTKTFGRNLGINWGFNGVADAAHGNTTNLVFPNNGSVSGRVGLEAPATNTLNLRLGNVLDTFNLDVALQAAEQQGLVKIVSSPKVQAMTNQQASIQTGLQIPVQTTVNNTTSVVYVNATLQLQVTPQITAEGTVLMDLNIQKREPAQGVQIQGGGNVPLSIRQAQTKVIVKDGGTTVIGGIFQMNDQDNYNHVPGLWKIPILGNLFRNSQISDKHDELLIFVTPRIVH
jgi:type IV pilus assembly protein PilQ